MKRIFLGPLLAFIISWMSYSIYKSISNLHDNFHHIVKSNEIKFLEAVEKNDPMIIRRILGDLWELGAADVSFERPDARPENLKRIVLTRSDSYIFQIGIRDEIQVNGLNVGSVSARYPVFQIAGQAIYKDLGVILTILLVGLFTLFFVQRQAFKSIQVVHEIVLEMISKESFGDSDLDEKVQKLIRSDGKGDVFSSDIAKLIVKQQQTLREVSKARAVEAVSKQVAHDIRSPLSALTMVMGTLKDLPEEKRILIRNATQRINDIANDLLQKKQADKSPQKSLKLAVKENPQKSVATVEFIPAILDVLVSEKRIQYRELSGVEILIDLRDSFGAFARIRSDDLKRVISNLINNAVEAFDGKNGSVLVSIRKLSTDGLVEVTVKDNGKGIPDHILNRLGYEQISHGKSDSSQSGSGIGVYHARQTIISFGGQFDIKSGPVTGTTIIMKFPIAKGPDWFLEAIDLKSKTTLVSLDDDETIHQIWAGRLQSKGLSEIEHIRFQSGEIFTRYFQSNLSQMSKTLYLVDYELLNQPKTGLDLIEDLGLGKCAVLVTSRYEEKDIQQRASRIGLKILPKSLAGFVPLGPGIVE